MAYTGVTKLHNEGIVTKYLDHMKLRNLRPWTVYNRVRSLRRLGEWADGPILYLTEKQLTEWQQQRSKQIEPESLRTETSSLRQFYQWVQREEYRVDDPTTRLIMPRVYRHLPRPIGDRTIADAMAAADIYMQAILALAAFAGLRACEIAQLDWSEVGLVDERKHLRIENGKGGKGRHIPLSDGLISILAVLPERRGPVIPRLDGLPGHNSSSVISKRANEYLHSVDIAETLHQCRHRFATTAYRACQDIRAVQELLGHASPTTTAIYAASASAVAIEAVERAGVLSVA